MNKKIKTEAVDHLFQAILTLKNPEECYIFFETYVRLMSSYLCHSVMR